MNAVINIQMDISRRKVPRLQDSYTSKILEPDFPGNKMMRKQIWEEAEMRFLHPSVKRFLEALLINCGVTGKNSLFQIPVQRNIWQTIKKPL